MQDQYSRTQLLLGKEAMEKLHNSRVAVFGIGGVGGYTVEALARSGVGALDLIDDDKVCLTNLNRQIVATRKTVGQYKVDVAEQRIHEIDPNIKVTTYKTFFTPETQDQFDAVAFVFFYTFQRLPRAIGLRLPASTSHKILCLCLAGRGPNNSSLHPPPAAVVIVAY